MLELDAVAFYEATRMLQYTQTFIEQTELTSHKKAKDGSVTIVPIDNAKTLKMLNDRNVDLRAALNVLGAKITLMALDDYDQTLKDFPTWDAIDKHTQDITRTLRRELSQAKVIALSSHEIGYYQPALPLFGAAFESKFKTDGAFELDEAAKCLALGRPTATVFHLMRTLEIGIRALAACLGIPDPIKPAERNWAIVLKSIRDGINAKWPDAAARMRPNCQLLEELHASLDAVKNPFRNATMHVVNKYTDAEAQHIFALVKGFMMKLADRMDENGEPKA